MRPELSVDLLKEQWERDPQWDIEDTEGFEEVREELLAYRKETERRWAEEREQKRQAQLEWLGDPANIAEIAARSGSWEQDLINLVKIQAALVVATKEQNELLRRLVGERKG